MKHLAWAMETAACAAIWMYTGSFTAAVAVALLCGAADIHRSMK